ncbi:MAG: alpha/beta hydrolase [Pseudomonadota bacterium]
MNAIPSSLQAAPGSAAHAPGRPVIRSIAPPPGVGERVLAAALRLSLRLNLKPFLGPPWPVGLQRAVMHALSCLMPPGGGVSVEPVTLRGPAGPLAAERIRPKGRQPRHAIAYFHGGAFCTGSPRTHRSITTRLARMADAEVLVVHYRRTPEARFPAQIDDCVAAYEHLLAQGFAPEHIALDGDSAGGALVLLVTAALRLKGRPLPAVNVMMSPLVDPTMTARSITERAHRDPMIRVSWGKKASEMYAAPHEHPLASPIGVDLRELPPTLVQVGEDEVLYDDSTVFAERAAQAGTHVELERHPERWHVFQVHAGLLKSSTQALQRQADFMRRHWAA